MSAERRGPVVVAWTSLIAVAALYLGWAVVPDSLVYREVLTPHLLLAIASLLKIGCLATGALLAFACRDRLDPGNPARPAWALMSAGLFATLAGQLSLAPYQIVAGDSPFPSVADLFYVLAYPFLIAAFLVFLRAHHESGFSTSSSAERVSIAAAVAIVGGTIVVRMLQPVEASGGEILDRMLNVAYPVLDLVLLMPLALLLRMTLRMRGSRVGSVWALLLAGFLFMAVGDMAFAYFVLGGQHLDPYIHATFLLSYGLVAGGAHRQLRLLKS